MEAGKSRSRREIAEFFGAPANRRSQWGFVKYRISIQPAAQRELGKLPADVRQDVVDAISALADDPRPHGVRKLSGSKESYRIRVGDYRVLYTIADRVLQVIVVKVGNRRDVYR